MVQGDSGVSEKTSRFGYDYSLLAALLDRWRPETHTFHLSVGEMTPTLQDVALLLGLPLRGAAVGPTDTLGGWREDLVARFSGVRRTEAAEPYREFAQSFTHGPPQWWVLQFSVSHHTSSYFIELSLHVLLTSYNCMQVKHVPDDATEYEVARYFEAYLLWLMGWVMFCNSHGNVAMKQLLPYARVIADAPLEEIPEYSWGSAVLAASLRGLCTACLKSRSAEPILVGCPLLLQLWSYERFQIGRPVVDQSPYRFEESTDPVDCPTMGWIWTRR